MASRPLCSDCGEYGHRCRCDYLPKKEEEKPAVNRYVYHYCTVEDLGGGQIVYSDGIAQLNERITSFEGYKKLKSGINPDDPSSISIINLSFLGRELDD